MSSRTIRRFWSIFSRFAANFSRSFQVRDAVEVLKQSFDSSELGNQVCGGLLSDSLDSRYIVHAVAGEGQNFAYTLRRNTPFVGDF